MLVRETGKQGLAPGRSYNQFFIWSFLLVVRFGGLIDCIHGVLVEIYYGPRIVIKYSTLRIFHQKTYGKIWGFINPLTQFRTP